MSRVISSSGRVGNFRKVFDVGDRPRWRPYQGWSPRDKMWSSKRNTLHGAWWHEGTCPGHMGDPDPRKVFKRKFEKFNKLGNTSWLAPYALRSGRPNVYTLYWRTHKTEWERMRQRTNR